MRTSVLMGTLGHPQMRYTILAIALLKFPAQSPLFICTQSSTSLSIHSPISSAMHGLGRLTQNYSCADEWMSGKKSASAVGRDAIKKDK